MGATLLFRLGTADEYHPGALWSGERPPTFPQEGPRGAPMGKDKADDSDLEDPQLALLTEEYEILDVIGTGHFAKVRKGRDKRTGELVAVKIITKPAPHKMKMLKAEVDIMTKLDHPNVVRLHKVVDTETKLYAPRGAGRISAHLPRAPLTARPRAAGTWSWSS